MVIILLNKGLYDYVYLHFVPILNVLREKRARALLEILL